MWDHKMVGQVIDMSNDNWNADERFPRRPTTQSRMATDTRRAARPRGEREQWGRRAEPEGSATSHTELPPCDVSARRTPTTTSGRGDLAERRHCRRSWPPLPMHDAAQNSTAHCGRPDTGIRRQHDASRARQPEAPRTWQARLGDESSREDAAAGSTEVQRHWMSRRYLDRQRSATPNLFDLRHDLRMWSSTRCSNKGVRLRPMPTRLRDGLSVAIGGGPMPETQGKQQQRSSQRDVETVTDVRPCVVLAFTARATAATTPERHALSGTAGSITGEHRRGKGCRYSMCASAAVAGSVPDNVSR